MKEKKRKLRFFERFNSLLRVCTRVLLLLTAQNAPKVPKEVPYDPSSSDRPGVTVNSAQVSDDVRLECVGWLRAQLRIARSNTHAIPLRILDHTPLRHVA